MAKYHISPETGQPAICAASIRECPVGGDHFKTVEAAREAYESRMAGETFAAKSTKSATKLPGELTALLNSASAHLKDSKNVKEVVDLLERSKTEKDPAKAQGYYERAGVLSSRASFTSPLYSFDQPAEDRKVLTELKNFVREQESEFKSYPNTPSGAAKALRDQLAITDLEPIEDYQEELSEFVSKPTAKNYASLHKAAKTSLGYSGTGHSHGGDHLAKAIVDTEEKIKKAGKDKRAASASRRVIDAVLQAEDWNSYDKKYPVAPTSWEVKERKLKPTTYSGQTPEGFRSVKGYFDVPGASFVADGAKASPNGGLQEVTYLNDGKWYTSTSAGFLLRGPFDTPDAAAECSRERSLDMGGHYYD